MFNYVVIRVLAAILLIYFAIDIVTTLIGKMIEGHKEDDEENTNHYLDDNYSIEVNNPEKFDVKKENIEMPEIPDNMAKKVSKAKEKMK